MELLETPEQAVLRELAEEAGLKGEVKRLVGVFYEESERLGSVIVLGYEVAVSGEPKHGGDALEAKFFDIGKLPQLAFLSQRKMLEIYNSKR
jgi:ADP-ribose pyrophosphatase YjhB (NUDIX family)